MEQSCHPDIHSITLETTLYDNETMSTSSSRRSSTPSGASNKSDASSHAANNIRYDILESNNIFISEGHMEEDQWSSIAFSLGLRAREGQRFTTTTNKLSQRMSKRKVHSATQTYDMLKPFIDSIVSTCPKLSQIGRCSYHADAVPTIDALKNTTKRLPTPKPIISVGYTRDAFCLSHDELQNGIIAGPLGEPCDLNHISQPVVGQFWPFFVVEISETSMPAALQASAITAATCNNALDLLAGAAADEKEWNRNSFSFDHKFTRSFSLSVHGKIASLSTHGAEGLAPFVAKRVASYSLDDDNDVASLADRLHSIMVWAHYNRLAEIIATLDQLDRKVHGTPSGMAISPDGYEFDPHCLKTLKLKPERKPNRMKVAVRAGMPSWLARA